MSKLPEEIKTADEYCESVTRKHAKSFYFAVKFLPEHKRQPIYAIYALCRHIDDEVDEAEVAGEKEAIEAVENWRRRLNSIYDEGEIELSDSESQNLVLPAWKNLLRTYDIDRNLPLDLMKGVLSDTRVKRYENFAELYVYCYRVASTVGLMSSEILGYSDEIALRFAEKMGIAMQLTNILRDIKEDAALGRIYLPREDLRKFDVSEQQILESEFDENFRRMMKFQVKRTRDFYREGEKGIKYLEKDSRFTVLLASRIYAKILDEIERLDYNVFLGRAHTTKLKKLLSIPLIWREARGI